MKEKNKLIIEKDLEHCGVVKLILNRPEVHNAFDADLIKLLIDALETLQHDDTVRAVILQSNGKHFSAGADLQWMQAMVNYSQEENMADSMQLAKLMERLFTLNKPTIVRVQGAALGGALGLIACCDMAVASETATFCFSEVKIGLIPAVISPYVIQAIGSRAAKRYFLTAEVFSANTAKQLGLLHEVVAENVLNETVDSLVKQLLKNSPKAVLAAKKLIHAVAQKPIDAQLIRKTAEDIATIRVSAEAQEGLTAFLNKRKST